MKTWRLLQYAITVTWILLLLVGCGVSPPQSTASPSAMPTEPRTTLSPELTEVVTIREYCTDFIIVNVEAYVDQNENGAWDPAETPLEGASFWTSNQIDRREVVNRANSDAKGQGEIVVRGSCGGPITIHAETPPGYQLTTPGQCTKGEDGGRCSFGFASLPAKTLGSTTAPTSAPVALSSLDRIASPGVPTADVHELTAGNNAFAFELYQSLRSGEGNLLFSPYSISQALAMIYAGARGATEQQMADTLHFALPQERPHPAFNALDLELGSRSHATRRTKQGTFQLDIANTVWGQEGYPFRPEYLDLLALNYGAGIRLVDFKKDAAAAIKAINKWVSEETDGRVQDIVSDLPEDTGFVLAMAIYFNAQWDLPFDREGTEDEPFYLLDGDEEKVPLMHQQDDFLYTEGDGYQAIQLPYLNHDVTMVILLPREGRFREIEERLTGDWMPSVVFSRHEVILTMPKFSFETSVLNLAETLGAMGMPDAFDASADFTGIIEQPGLIAYIAKVLHKAFIDVNEEGTEAAAVTEVEMEVIVGEAIGVPTEPPPIIMRIDRPFIFFIRDRETGAILFVGRVMNPARE